MFTAGCGSEKVLKEMGITHKLIPVLRHISSDCGICLQFTANLRNKIEGALVDAVVFSAAALPLLMRGLKRFKNS